MKRLLTWLLILYPRAWRERYGEEFKATLEQTAGTWTNLFDTLKGAILMHTSGKKHSKLILLFGLFSAVLTWAASISWDGVPHFTYGLAGLLGGLVLGAAGSWVVRQYKGI